MGYKEESEGYIMKATTIYQPYASLIACGAKRFETRSRRTHYRGAIAIHAAKLAPSSWLYILGRKTVRLMERALFRDEGDFEHYFDDLVRGAVVATADLVECWHIGHMNRDGEMCIGAGDPRGVDYKYDYIGGDELHFGDWQEGRYAWELVNVKPLPEPVSVRGKQGLWNWEL